MKTSLRDNWYTALLAFTLVLGTTALVINIPGSAANVLSVVNQASLVVALVLVLLEGLKAFSKKNRSLETEVIPESRVTNVWSSCLNLCFILLVYMSVSLLYFMEFAKQSATNPRLQKLDFDMFAGPYQLKHLLFLITPWLLFIVTAHLWRIAGTQGTTPWLSHFIFGRARSHPKLFLNNLVVALHVSAVQGLFTIIACLGLLRLFDAATMALGLPNISIQPFHFFILCNLNLLSIRGINSRFMKKIGREKVSFGYMFLYNLIMMFVIYLIAYYWTLNFIKHAPVSPSALFANVSPKTEYARCLLAWMGWSCLCLPMVSAKIAQHTQGLHLVPKFLLSVGLLLGVGYCLNTFTDIGTYKCLIRFLTLDYVCLWSGVLLLLLLYKLTQHMYGFSDIVRLGFTGKGNWLHHSLKKIWPKFWIFFVLHFASLFLFGFWLDQVLCCVLGIYLSIAVLWALIKGLHYTYLSL